MIMMRQPSLCLNSHDVPGPHYRMWKTYSLEEGVTASQVVRLIQDAHNSSMIVGDEGLYNVIINCHGSSGGLSIGGKGKYGIDTDNVGVFAGLRGRNIGTIWLVACEAASQSGGQSFCSKLAVAACALVIASDASQEVTPTQYYRYYAGLSGQIDGYEGMVYAFYADGSVSRDVDPEEASGHTIKT
jgi:hypothetical protein